MADRHIAPLKLFLQEQRIRQILPFLRNLLTFLACYMIRCYISLLFEGKPSSDSEIQRNRQENRLNERRSDCI